MYIVYQRNKLFMGKYLFSYLFMGKLFMGKYLFSLFYI